MKIKILLIMLMLCLAGGCISYASGEEMELLIFNAGKADACLLRTANSTVLIDTGKNKFGKELVDWLNANEITEIDVMFISHFDKDHVGGADKVLEAVNVHQIYEPAYTCDSKQYIQYCKAIQAAGVAVDTLSHNLSFELDGATYKIDVANQAYYGEDEENDFSLVISIQYGDTSFLFCGDAENPRLWELLNEGVGHHDLLKVPHHGKGEDLSDLFFQAVSPNYSIITSDDDDLEEPEVVDALMQYGKVYLTRHGNVHVTSDGKKLTVVQ